MNAELLKRIPSINELLAVGSVEAWLQEHPRKLVTDCLRQAVEELRRGILADEGGQCGAMHVSTEYILQQAGDLLAEKTRFHLRSAINATGVLMHTGLGRSVLPECVVDSMLADLKGYVTLAVDRETGERSERDQRVEYILTELTGAEAAALACNNAAATLMVLSALAADKETIVSRGQLIEIGGSFRLPDVMSQSRTKMVEVGTTNRTHLRDYERAITDATAVLLRVHPSNFRVMGFTAEVELADMVELAKARGLACVDDLGAGALVGLERFGLPHEPTVQESIAAGADVVLFSGDKLIGGPQAGIIVGKKKYIEKIAKHPLARACRPDKTCVMALERTLHLFRDEAILRAKHPLYRMLATPLEALEARARKLAEAIHPQAGKSPLEGATLNVEVAPGHGYLGSGSLPMEHLASWTVQLSSNKLKAGELARRLRMDEACVFARVESDRVILDVRTVTDEQIPPIAGAAGRATTA